MRGIELGRKVKFALRSKSVCILFFTFLEFPAFRDRPRESFSDAWFSPGTPLSPDLARKMMTSFQEVIMTITKKIISCLVFLSFIMVLIGTVAVSAQQSQTATKTLVNINTADSRQLESLPRIGPKMAVRILDYRKANGSFKRVQDLMKVKGVGPKIFEKLQSLITV